MRRAPPVAVLFFHSSRQSLSCFEGPARSSSPARCSIQVWEAARMRVGDDPRVLKYLPSGHRATASGKWCAFHLLRL